MHEESFGGHFATHELNSSWYFLCFRNKSFINYNNMSQLNDERNIS